MRFAKVLLGGKGLMRTAQLNRCRRCTGEAVESNRDCEFLDVGGMEDWEYSFKLLKWLDVRGKPIEPCRDDLEQMSIVICVYDAHFEPNSEFFNETCSARQGRSFGGEGYGLDAL